MKAAISLIRIRPIMPFVISVGLVVGLLGVLCCWVPVAHLHGRKIVLKDLLNPSVRLGLKVESAERTLAECEILAPDERLPRLLELEQRFSQVYVAGDNIREAVIATGLDQAVPHMKRILRDSPGGQGCVLRGIRKALDHGNPEEGYRIETFKLLMEGLNHEDLFGFCSTDIPELLIRLDEERAVCILNEICEKEPDHYLITSILETQHADDLLLSLAAAGKILSSAKSPENIDDARRQIAAAKAIHRGDPARAIAHLENIVASGESSMAMEAGEALLELKDLPHPVFSLDDFKSSVGFDALGEAEKTVWLACHCGWLIRPDNMYQLDSDEDGHLLAGMHKAVLQVGAPKAAARLKAYMDLYGPGGPPESAEDRSRIAGANPEEWNRSIDVIEQSHEDWENLTCLAIQYELRHSEQFHKNTEVLRTLELQKYSAR